MQNHYNVDFDQVLFISDSKQIDINIPIKNQCKNGETVRICKIHVYKIVWNGHRTYFDCFTNIPYSFFIYYLFHHLGISEAEYNRYELKIGNQLISSTFQIPYIGIFDEIHVQNKSRNFIVKNISVDGISKQNSQVAAKASNSQ